MPYILFNTHHWQRAASQETHKAASLHNISGYTRNHSSVNEGQHATRLFHVDHKVTFAMQCEQKLWFHLMGTLSHFPFSRPQQSDSLLHEMDINHLLSTFDFKASWFWSSSMNFLWLYFFEKTVNQMDCKSMRAGCCCCEYMIIHYPTALLIPCFSPFSFLMSTSPIRKHSVTFKHTSPCLLTSKHQSLTTNWKWNSQNPPKLRHELLPAVKTKFKNINFPFLLLRFSFQYTFLFQSFLHIILSILPTSDPPSAPASISFFSQVELNESQHCKIHMMSSGNVDMWKY